LPIRPFAEPVLVVGDVELVDVMVKLLVEVLLTRVKLAAEPVPVNTIWAPFPVPTPRLLAVLNVKSARTDWARVRDVTMAIPARIASFRID